MSNTIISYSLSENLISGRLEYNSTNISPTDNGQIELTGDSLKASEKIDLLNLPFNDGVTYHLDIVAFDLAGNPCIECGNVDFVTNDFTAPTIKQTSPLADSFLPITQNSKIRVDFSEPITAYKVDASSKLGINLNTTIQQASDSLVISLNAPLTSLDTLTFKLTNITDRAGSVGDSMQVSYLSLIHI